MSEVNRVAINGQNSDSHRGAGLHFTAYLVSQAVLDIGVAPACRDWMDSTDKHFANRCLPLRMANQAGWFIFNGVPFEAIWHGGNDVDSVEIRCRADHRGELPVSNCGYGIVTWRIPYLFRTPPGYNVVVRGPTNWIKDGACPLDGLVETDWSVATFTMNWKLTRPGLRVRFNAGDPICMVFPQRRGELESFLPEIRSISADPPLEAAFREWKDSRNRFMRFLNSHSEVMPNHGWQKHYFLGQAATGEVFPSHQTKLSLRPFQGAPAVVDRQLAGVCNKSRSRDISSLVSAWLYKLRRRLMIAGRAK